MVVWQDMAKNPLFCSVLATKHHWFCRIGGVNVQKRGFHSLFGADLPKNLRFQHLFGQLLGTPHTGGPFAGVFHPARRRDPSAKPETKPLWIAEVFYPARRRGPSAKPEFLV